MTHDFQIYVSDLPSPWKEEWLNIAAMTATATPRQMNHDVAELMLRAIHLSDAGSVANNVAARIVSPARLLSYLMLAQGSNLDPDLSDAGDKASQLASERRHYYSREGQEWLWDECCAAVSRAYDATLASAEDDRRRC